MRFGFAFILAVLSFLSFDARAQMFDPSIGIEEDAAPKVVTPVPTTPVATTQTQAKPQQAQPQAPKKEEVFVPKSALPQNMRPTLDGSTRGSAVVRTASTEKGSSSSDDGIIFIYYKDFSVKRMMSGIVSCDMTFVVLTTLDRKISNMSVKLKWPDMLTTLSFDEVNPNVETTIKYTLLGEGCYSMDKVPNIVVNRCRVKDMTQQVCANKIRWLKKN